MIFRKSTELCDHLHNIDFGYLHHSSEISHTHLQLIPFSAPALGNHQSTVYLYRLDLMNIQYKWSHIFVVFCIWSFPLSIWIRGSSSSNVSVFFLYFILS